MRQAYRGILEVVRDAQAAKRDDGTERRCRRNPRPAFRGVAELIKDGKRQQEAVTLSNGTGRQGAGSDGFDRAAEANQWRADLRSMRQAQGPQGRTGCGVLDDFGNCINRTHTQKCAKSMSSAAAQAGFAQQGSAEADRLWAAAKAERERMAKLTGGPAYDASAAERTEKARVARAEKERRAAARVTGAEWVATGKGADWFKPAG